MKQLLLAGTAVLGFAASGSVANAVPIDFTYTGSLIDFTVPATGPYQILAYGAQGGSGGFSVGTGGPSATVPGGLGAEIGGNFILTAGEILQVAVGGAGADQLGVGGGGGGGTFVVGPDNTPLVIAGGGGGAVLAFPMPGQGGLTGPDGGFQQPPAGTNGNGGAGGGGFAGGGGGGGFLSAGGNGLFPGDPVSGVMRFPVS